MGIPIARIFGIEIRVQLGWALVLALIAVIAVGQLTAVDPEIEAAASWILGGVVAFGFFLSSVAHDLAHALVARRRGVDVRADRGLVLRRLDAARPAATDPGDDAAIAASGPLVSIAIGRVLFALTVGAIALGDSFSGATGVLSVLVFLNLILGLVNLVPAYPLDGGRIVRDLAWRRSGSEQSGWRAASRTGRVTGFVVIAIGIAVAGSSTATSDRRDDRDHRLVPRPVGELGPRPDQARRADRRAPGRRGDGAESGHGPARADGRHVRRAAARRRVADDGGPGGSGRRDRRHARRRPGAPDPAARLDDDAASRTSWSPPKLTFLSPRRTR